MKRAKWILPALLVLACAAAALPALASRQAAPQRVDCGLKAFDIYFWPHGHPAVPSLGFPAFAPTHLELYVKGSLANTATKSVVTSTGGGFAKTCKKVAASPLAPPATSLKRVAKTRRIRCAFPSKVELQLIPAGGAFGYTLVANPLGKKTTLVSVLLKGTSSYARFSGKYCKATPIAGVP
jgi:hypothetical protein